MRARSPLKFYNCDTNDLRERSAAPEWLALPAVTCVGGSWLVPAGAVDPDAIRERARKAAALRPGA